nr:AAA family ATPase [Cytophagales bacterium]
MKEPHLKRLILIMGLPGSGKSFFGKRLADSIGATYFNSDKERNRLGKRGNYALSDKRLIYEVLLELAKDELEANKDVIVDATFQLQSLRELFFQLAKREGATCYCFYIHAAELLVRERLSRPRIESEADFQVYLKLKEEFDPFHCDVHQLESRADNIAEMLESAQKTLKHGKK